MHLIVYSVASQQLLDILCVTPHHRFFAYIDPGTGSFVIQIVIAALAGCSLAIKIYWSKIKTFVRSLFSKEGKTP
jgi:hypothetical protein